MPERHFPVRPNLEQLRRQAKDLLDGVRKGDASAVAELEEFSTKKIEPGDAKLADAQLALARSYRIASWPRLVQACQMTDAIWRDDVGTVRKLVQKHPRLVHEMALGREKASWGPPMSYAANLGRDKIIAALYEAGATDLDSALARAALWLSSERCCVASAGASRDLSITSIAFAATANEVESCSAIQAPKELVCPVAGSRSITTTPLLSSSVKFSISWRTKPSVAFVLLWKEERFTLNAEK